MNYRIIALDVDGTLLNDQHELTDATKRTVRAVHEAGATIVLCTGRGPTNTFPYMEQLGLSGVLITHNGAATVRSESRETIHLYPFELDQVMPFVRYCREQRVHFDISTTFDIYVEKNLNEEERLMYEKFMISPISINDVAGIREPLVKFTVAGSTDVMDRVEHDWASFEHSLNIIRSGDQFIDIMHPSATKGNALQQLANTWNISHELILAIGNYYNDVDMIKFAGMGIAMENSPEPVKQVADDMTKSNNEDGVHFALSKYCL